MACPYFSRFLPVFSNAALTLGVRSSPGGSHILYNALNAIEESSWLDAPVVDLSIGLAMSHKDLPSKIVFMKEPLIDSVDVK